MTANLKIVTDEFLGIPASGEPAWAKDVPTMTSGFGQIHTNEFDPAKPDRRLRPYEQINFDGIRHLVDNPQQVDKSKGQWVIPSSLPSRTFKEQEQNGEYWMLWSDLDKDPKPLDDVHAALLYQILNECDHEVYTSRSATDSNQKGRILVFLSKPLSGIDWGLCQEALNDKLEDAGIIPDRASERFAQLCYLPNRGAFYDSRSQRNGELFDPLTVWAGEIAEKRDAIKGQAAALEALRKAAAKRREALGASDAPDTIGAFNRAYTVQEMLLRNGYDQRGNTFRHPNSESGSYSASIDPKTGRVHSLSSADPISIGKGAHDAFSVFQVLFHDNNLDAALKDAGNNWLMIGGEPWNKVKQREFMQNKTKTDAVKELTELVEQPVSKQANPFELEYPPGLAGQIAEYIFRSSRMPVKSFAIAGALQTLSYLNANKKWVAPSDTALNLYQCMIGGTGKGKEDPRKAIKRLVGSLLFAGGICESLSSGPALLRSLETDKEMLILTDEFGLFIQVALSDKGSMHLKELVKELLTLFGLGRSYFAGKKYADAKQSIGKINQPYVNLLGTTTPVELLEGVTSKSVDNGFLNRILFVAASEENPINRSPDTAIPDSLYQALELIVSSTVNGLTYEEGAHDLMVDLAEQMGEDGAYTNLWSRAEEQMIRVAGILAIGDGAEIKRGHVMWAFRYVNWCIRSFSAFLGTDLAESVFEKRIVKARSIINNARSYSSDMQFGKMCRMGYMPRGKLTKLMKITSKELDDVIRFLTESRQASEGDFEGFRILFPVGDSLENSPGKSQSGS